MDAGDLTESASALESSEPSTGDQSDLTTMTGETAFFSEGSSSATVAATTTTTAATGFNDPSYQLDQNAIIAGIMIGLLLIAITLAGVCLARARRQRASGGRGGNCSDRESATGKAGESSTREPNPYINPCFDGSKEEMNERLHHTEEPAKNIAESVNSVRNKEDHWIIPVEELKEDDAASNYDTTRF